MCSIQEIVLPINDIFAPLVVASLVDVPSIVATLRVAPS
jgi:hypothetical protein